MKVFAQRPTMDDVAEIWIIRIQSVQFDKHSTIRAPARGGMSFN